jgi:hypothetical protein
VRCDRDPESGGDKESRGLLSFRFIGDDEAFGFNYYWGLFCDIISNSESGLATFLIGDKIFGSSSPSSAFYSIEGSDLTDSYSGAFYYVYF